MSFTMQTANQDIHARVAHLTNALIGLTAKEALARELWNRERKEILRAIESINEVVGTKETYGNGMAAVELSKLYGWKLRQPDRIRGQYFGLVIALEFHVAIVKVSASDLLELPFGSMAETETHSPRIGDTIHMAFRDGVLTAKVTERKH